MLLAIDSSSITASAALLDGETLISEAFLNNGLKHSRTVAPLIASVLANAGAAPEDVRQVVVTNGPGSFTGLRIGVAAALGFAAALKIPCAGVSSLMAAAYGALGRGGTVAAVMDARRGQFYHALFGVRGNTLTRLSEDDAADKETIYQKAPSPVIWAGDAAEQCKRDGDTVLPRPYVSGYGAALCFLGGFTRPADKIVYLRMPQAERERLERSAQQRPVGELEAFIGGGG